jgi:hypothetical protein
MLQQEGMIFAFAMKRGKRFSDSENDSFLAS